MRKPGSDDFNPLFWVKDALSETLENGKTALERYIDDQSQQDLIEQAQAHYSVAKGTFKMLEYYGAAMLAEELVELLQAIAQGKIKLQDDVVETAMRASLQVADYLGWLESGNADNPIVIMPILNDLRAARHAELLSESVFFIPALKALPETVKTANQAELGAVAAKLRPAFELALLGWIQNNQPKSNLARMSKVLTLLQEKTSQPDFARLWWVGAAVIEAMVAQGTQPGLAIKRLLSKLNLQVKQVATAAGQLDKLTPPQELVKNLLYYAARSPQGTPKIDQVRKAFNLEGLLPSKEEIETARDALTGPNQALLATVAETLKEDLIEVKDGIDIYARGQRTDTGRIEPYIAALKRVADTLTMLGMGAAQSVVREQADKLKAIVADPAVATNEVLMQVARVLISVEQGLDDFDALKSLDAAALDSGESDKAELDEALQVVIREALQEFGVAKEHIIAYADDATATAHLALVPESLRRISGALAIMNLSILDEFMKPIQKFISGCISHSQYQPSADEMQALAIAITSLEYYLEALVEERGDTGIILENGRKSLLVLNEANDRFAQEAEDEPSLEVAIEEAPVAQVSEGLAPGAAALLSEDIDEEILGIFIEEAAEEYEAIAESLGKWRSNPENQDALTRLRRAFHTLKGSGRLIGAELIGEFAWGYEQMLNRELEAKRTPEPAIFGLLEKGVDCLGRLIGALKGEGEASVAEVDELRLKAATFGLDEQKAQDVQSQQVVLSAVDTPVIKVETEVSDSLPLVEEIEMPAEAEPELELEEAEEPSAETVLEPSLLDEPLIELDAVVPAEDADKTVEMSMAELQAMLESSSKAAEEPSIELEVEAQETAEDFTPGDTLEMSLAELEEYAGVPANAEIAEPLEQALEPEEHPFRDSAAKGEEEIFAELLEDVDQDLLSILIAEAKQEVRLIQQHLATWLDNQSEASELTPVRRAFHTIKGNARLIGAKRLGDFSEAFERLIESLGTADSAIDETVSTLLANGVVALEELIDQFETGVAPASDIESLLLQVERYLSGEPHAEVAEVTQPAEPAFEMPDELEFDVASTGSSDTTIAPVEDTQEIEMLPSEMVDVAPEPVHSANIVSSPIIDLDPVLYDIFRQEADAHIQTILEITSKYQGKSSMPASDELLRAVHTLTGSARTAQVAILAEIGGMMHRFVDQTRQLSQDIRADGIRLLHAGAEAAQEILRSMDERRPHADLDQLKQDLKELLANLTSSTLEMPRVTDLVEEAKEEPVAVEEIIPVPAVSEPAAKAEPAKSTKTPAKPVVTDFHIDPSEYDQPTEQDEELVNIFLEEGEELLDSCESAMNMWNADYESKEAVMELQRSLHTLKGGSRMAGLNNIGDLTHLVESLVIDIADKRVTFMPQMLDLIQGAFDRVHDMLASVKDRQPVAPAKDLLAQIEFVRENPEEAFEGMAQGMVAVAPAASVAPAESQVQEVQQPEQQASDASRGVEEESGTPHRRATDVTPVADTEGRQGSHEMVRVRQDALDNLVNYAGEVSIYHGRLEQQILAFGQNLMEMDQTVRRLRIQLRELEIEIESQVRFSYEQEMGEAAKHADFDPLEMDRYTTLQERSRTIMESISDLQSIQGLMGDHVKEAETLLIQQSRISTDLQDGLMRTRMVQFGGLGPRLRRIVRQTSQELGKQAQLHFHGMESELDRTVLEHMVAPLEHMLRNAVAHGLETPAERIQAGKGDSGNITISVRSEGSDVVILVEDDGRGIDLEAIREKAIRIGMLSPSASVTDQELMQFILEPGFSTAKVVNQIAGRGVGMDVVHSEIKQLGGFLRIDSVKGEGTTFVIRLPYTLAINKAILAGTAEELYAIPLGNMEGLVRLSNEQLAELYRQDDPYYEYAGNRYRLHYLGQLLGLANPLLEGKGVMRPLLMMRAGGERVAIQADLIQGNREIFIKPVGPQISKVRGIAGATILGDGRVVLVLDVSDLVIHGQVASRIAEASQEKVAATQAQPTVMVVDDSITIRKVTTRMLARNGYNTLAAKDGVDALGQLQDHLPDVMLLDIEMPRMDGFELATHIRNDARLKHLPIIMITSRTGEKHRNRALEIGVNHYLGKPYQETDLLEKIQEVIRATAEQKS